MLTQPVRVTKDGKIDDRYKLDEYDEMIYQADLVLMAPCHALEEHEKAVEYRDMWMYRAQGTKGYDYAEMGKYGCRITGSGYVDKDPLVEMMSANEKVLEALDNWKKVCGECSEKIRECYNDGKITELQAWVLYWRYCSSPDGLLKYETVALMTEGLNNYKQAYYQHQKAYTAFALWWHDKQAKEDYERCMQIGDTLYESTLYGMEEM